jgi:hypothetical protein
MPFFYDVQRVTTSNGSANTETTHLAVKTVANQETAGIFGVIGTARSLTAGGGQLRTKHNTGTVYSGGSSQTPAPKNLRGAPAAQASWVNDGSAITPGTALVLRSSVGFAQTGGTGGLQPIQQQAAYQLMPNSTNPIDMEWTSIMASASIAIDITVETGEGI